MRAMNLKYSAANEWTSGLRRRVTLCGAACFAVALAACAPTGTPSRPTATMLLVSLEDGSIIRQDIAANADVCMKSIDSPATTCFQQGAPILDGDIVIGYEMHRSEIQLLPK